MGIFIIAEAGVNHNGGVDTAKRMIEEAKNSGADCIKFQTFHADNLVIKNARKAEYQIRQTGNQESQYEMLKKLELSEDSFYKLKQFCDEIGIEFLSTPFDIESIHFLQELGVKRWKIPSGEITNLPYLQEIAATNKEVILSTGMASFEEIQAAVTVFASSDLCLLHCTTEYPADFLNVNLNALRFMKRYFNIPIGYSDHTEGIEVAIAAAALGAVVIEKHFTIDRLMPGPDHKASLEPKDLKQMVTSIRHIERALGDENKIMSESELQNKLVVRKSIVAKEDIKQGTYFSCENLTTKRPGTGISPMNWYEIIGKQATKNFKQDDFITPDGVY